MSGQVCHLMLGRMAAPHLDRNRRCDRPIRIPNLDDSHKHWLTNPTKDYVTPRLTNSPQKGECKRGLQVYTARGDSGQGSRRPGPRQYGTPPPTSPSAG